MNVPQIIKTLQQKYPGKNIVENKNSNGETSEILCELEPASEHPDYSVAIAVIDKSVPHQHAKTTEIYEILVGELDLFVDGQKTPLKAGDKYTITPGKKHYAIGKETWIKATSNPGWTIQDHLI
jgi:mannose-6-phosphate isomerase-like protein (cupin superfamily)